MLNAKFMRNIVVSIRTIQRTLYLSINCKSKSNVRREKL